MLKLAPQISKYKVLNRWSIDGNYKCMTFGELEVPGGPVGYQWLMVFLEELPNGELDEKLFVAAEFEIADTEKPRRLALGVFSNLGHDFKGLDNELYDYEYFCKAAMDVGRPLLK